MATLVSGAVFAHIARSLVSDGTSLTLVDLAPSTIWLPRAPSAGLGYLPTGAFLDLWRDDDGGQEPVLRRVTGTLSILDPDAQIAGEAVLVLTRPRVTASGLTYDVVDLMRGVVPARSGACVLFLSWDAAPTTGDGAASVRSDDREGPNR